MQLSACYIVKNAESVLEKSLQSLKKSVDEVIVVDTGSIDKTLEIAQKEGAQIFCYEWQDDFAAARNFALSKAKGEWIVFIDADEYFSQETAENLRTSIENRMEDNEVLFVKITNIDTDQNGMVLDSFFAPRIMKKDASLCYEGRIHEQLMKNGQSVTAFSMVPERELSIYHTGYSNLQVQAKAQRNLALLLTELQSTDCPEKLYVHLAEAYDGIGDAVQAMHYAKLDIKGGRKNITYASRSYRIYLRLLEQMYPQSSEAEQILKKAMQEFPELPEFRAEYAQYLATKFDYEAAIFQMRQALQANEKHTVLEQSLFDDAARSLAKQLVETWEQTKQLQNTLKLSACVIVKNEAKEIGSWIENMKQCTDEQIIVDTGSTDDTVAVAEAAGVKVYYYEWDDDFAAAKNFAVEQATGDWIVFLDADEKFTPATVGNVRRIIAREHPRINAVDAIICPIINIDIDKNNKEINRFLNLRLFRNTPHLRYHGNVHEGVRYDDGELRIMIEKKDLEIYHTGYSSNRINEKLKRNLKLLQEDIAEKGEGIQHYRYLVDCYQGLGDYEQAIKYAKLHLASNASSIGSESDIYRNLINAMVLLKKDSSQIEPYLKKAVELFSDIPDFYAYYAADFFRRGELAAAKKYLLLALDVYKKKSGDTNNSSSFAYILSETYSYLGEIFLQEKDEIKARYYIDLALQDNPRNCQAFHQLYTFISRQPIAVVAETLAKYYRVNRVDLEFLLHCLEGEGASEVYFYYADLLEKEYHIISKKTIWHKNMAEYNATDVYESALHQLTEDLQMLTSSLLCMDKIELPLELDKVLPTSFLCLIQSYHGMRGQLEESDYDGYMALLPTVLRLDRDEVVQQFLKLGKEFSLLSQMNIARQLCENNRWSEADGLFDKIFAASSEQNDELRRMAGICAYHCGNYDKAEEYLRRAEREKASAEIKAYIAWIADKKQEKD